MGSNDWQVTHNFPLLFFLIFRIKILKANHIRDRALQGWPLKLKIRLKKKKTNNISYKESLELVHPLLVAWGKTYMLFLTPKTNHNHYLIQLI